MVAPAVAAAAAPYVVSYGANLLGEAFSKPGKMGEMQKVRYNAVPITLPSGAKLTIWQNNADEVNEANKITTAAGLQGAQSPGQRLMGGMNLFTKYGTPGGAAKEGYNLLKKGLGAIGL